MDPVASQKRSLQQIYAKLNQNGQAFGAAMSAYNRIAGSALFDPVYYNIFYPDALKQGLEPLAHYILHGAAEGRSTHPLFDGKYYNKQVPGKNKIANGLQHYLENSRVIGVNPNILFDWQYYFAQTEDKQKCSPLDAFVLNYPSTIENPCPLFDSAYYLAFNDDVRASGINPLVHFVLLGAYEGRSPHPLFDTAYYLRGLNIAPLEPFELAPKQSLEQLYAYSAELKRTQDVYSFINALVHYLELGQAERRDPHPLFSSSFYLQNHPQISDEPINPLLHYISEGAAEGLKPHVLFDPATYKTALKNRYNEDVPNEHLLSHFLTKGGENNLSPHSAFDSEIYCRANKNAKESTLNPLVHYLVEPGELEHRVTSDTFDGEFYMRFYSDVQPSGLTPLEHFVRHGVKENRATNFCDWARKRGKQLDPALDPGRKDEPIDSFLPNSATPYFSIILLGYGEPDILARCLRALKRQLVPEKFELIVTQASPEEKPLLDRLDINVRDRGNRNTETVNRAAREANGKILVFLQKNVLPLDGFFSTIKAQFDKIDAPTLVCPRVITALGRNKHIGFLLKPDFELLRVKTFLDAFDEPTDEFPSIDVCMRDCFAVKKDDFIRLGGFDEKIVAEKIQDLELSIRAKQLGFRINSLPVASVLAVNEYARASVQVEPMTEEEENSRQLLKQSLQVGKPPGASLLPA